MEISAGIERDTAIRIWSGLANPFSKNTVEQCMTKTLSECFIEC